MKKNLPQIDKMDPLQDFHIPWKKSQAQVWADLSEKMGQHQPHRIKPSFRIGWQAAAATFLIVISGVLFMRFYETQEDVGNGQHSEYRLPDGSLVSLNAGSTLSFHPLWFWIDRHMKFSGEGYFNVEKGLPFRVRSAGAETRVLGTSFTIYARGQDYRVICHTGLVEVISGQTGARQQLQKDQKLFLNEFGIFEIELLDHGKDEANWIDGVFEYTSVPLSEVFEEIERQYNVRIKNTEGLNYYYTGDFSSKRELEIALYLVCKPFKITFEKISEGVYTIVQE